MASENPAPSLPAVCHAADLHACLPPGPGLPSLLFCGAACGTGLCCCTPADLSASPASSLRQLPSAWRQLRAAPALLHPAAAPSEEAMAQAHELPVHPPAHPLPQPNPPRARLAA